MIVDVMRGVSLLSSEFFAARVPYYSASHASIQAAGLPDGAYAINLAGPLGAMTRLGAQSNPDATGNTSANIRLQTVTAGKRAIASYGSGSLTVPVYTLNNEGEVSSLYERYGTGSPEGVVTAPVGAVFHRTDGAAFTTQYRKETGSGNTGWVLSGVDTISRVGSIGFVMDGGGILLTTGGKGQILVPYACTINNWYLYNKCGGA
jgi:hypothetical protein